MLFHALPSDVQALAVKNYHLWRENPSHPSLRFRSLKGDGNRCTVRIGEHHRALGVRDNESVVWVWIGTHAEYDRLV